MSDRSGSDSEAGIDTIANKEYQNILPKECLECLMDTGLSAPVLAQPVVSHSERRNS